MVWQTTPYLSPLIALALILGLSAIYVINRRREVPSASSGALVLLAASFWVLAYALELASANLSAKVVWDKVQYCGIVVIPTGWLFFSLEYTGRGSWLTWRTVALLSILPFAVLLLVFTNDIHGLIWSGARLRIVSSGVATYHVLEKTLGVGSWAFLAYSILVFVLAGFLLVQMLAHSGRLFRWQGLTLLYASALLLFGGLVEWLGSPPLDILALGVTASSLILVMGLSGLQRADLVQVSRGVILESVSDGIVLLDAANRIVDLNPVALRWLGRMAAEVVGQQVQEVWPGWAERVGDAPGGIVPDGELQMGSGADARTVDVRTSPVLDWRGHPVNRVVVLRDVTEQKRAQEDLQSRVKQLAALGDASRAVTASLESDQVLGEITSLASKVVPADYVSVALVDESGDIEQSAETLAGVPGIDYRIRENGLTRWIFLSRKPVVVDEIDADGRIHPDPAEGAPRAVNPFLIEAGVKSLVGLPLVFGDRLIGVLYLHSKTAGAFGGQLPLLTAFASQASIAVRNVRAYGAERRRVSQMAVVNQVARKVVSILEPDQILEEIVRAIQQGFGYFNVTLLLVDKAVGELGNQAMAGGFADRGPPDYRQAVGEGLIGWAAEQGQALLVNDVSQDPRYVVGFAGEVPTRAELCVPLKLGDGVIGVLDVQETREGAFDETDLMAMETLADLLAVAIENARLFRELEEELAERVLAEKGLRDTNVRLSSLIHAIPDIVYFKDVEGRYLVVNRAFGEFAGASEEEIVGKTDWELLPADVVERFRISDQEALQECEPVHLEEQVPTERGGTITFDTIKVPLLDRDGNPIGLLGVSRDITERKQAEEEIRRHTSQMESLRELALEITAQLDLDALLRSIVSRAVQLLEAAAGGLYLYRPDQDVLEWVVAVGPDMAPVGSTLRRGEGLSGKVWETGEALLVDDYSDWKGRADIYQGYSWSAVLGVPIRWGEEFLGVLDVLTDPPRAFSTADAELLGLFAIQAAIAIENARLYSDLQRQMEQLQQTQGQLIQSAKLAAVGELSAGLAHELNNPLTSILGYAELLLETDVADGAPKEDLERIATEAHRACEIVQNLSEFSRQTKARREPADVNELLQRTLAVVRYHFETSGVRIEESYCQDPPPSLLDPGQIRQVWLNLITNAFQAMPEGGTLGVQTVCEENGVAVSISDTGIGMSPSVRERIFEPFFTTDPSRKGLGLSVSLGVVQEHGGRIMVETREGQGSTFTVWLPAMLGDEGEADWLFAEDPEVGSEE